MKTQNYRNLWPMLVLFLLVLPLAALAADPADNTAGPLTWKKSGVPSRYTAADAVKRAAQYLGVSGSVQPTTTQFVQVTDFTPYGNIRKTVFYAWLVTVPGVPVANANSKDSATVEVTVLVDETDKGLDAAFTAKNKEKWVARYSGYKERDPFQVMAGDGWTVDKPLSTQLNATVSQVLSAFWKTTGISPADAGQLFLRPRFVTLALPAERVGGKLVPLRRPGTYWTVLVSGTKTLDVIPPPSASPSPALKGGGDTPYMSGLIALFDDIGAQSARGVYLP